MVVQERLFSADELLALPRDEKRYALIEGHLIEMLLFGKTHGQLATRIGSLLDLFVSERGLGQVYGTETGFKLREKPDTVYGIDVAFVTKARAQFGEDYFHGAPDLAVEVVSPSNTRVEMHKKVADLFAANCRLIWVVYPQSRVVCVYRAPDQVQILTEADTLDGGNLLPGFSVKLSQLFAILSA